MFNLIPFFRKVLAKHSLLRFAMVGVLCTMIDSVVYWLMLFFVPYSTAMVVGYFVSLLLNFILTTVWTFRASVGATNFIVVLVVHLFNCFVLRAGLLDFFVQDCLYEEITAYFLTILVSVPINYVLLRSYFSARGNI